MGERRRPDPAGFAAGLTFTLIGVVGLALPADDLVDALRWLWPVTLLVVGAALLAAPSVPSAEDGAGDQVGAEGGEDGEVQQAGGGHDG